MIRYLPNILSASRLLIACMFPFVPEIFWLWFILYGGASDFLDGWIARRLTLTSWEGGLLDAIADKLFVFSVLVTFVLTGRLSAGLVPLVIARDLTVALIALYAACFHYWSSFKKMDARWSGKITTLCQFCLMVAIVKLQQFSALILYSTVLVSFVAACDYTKEFVKALVAHSKDKTA